MFVRNDPEDASDYLGLLSMIMGLAQASSRGQWYDAEFFFKDVQKIETALAAQAWKDKYGQPCTLKFIESMLVSQLPTFKNYDYGFFWAKTANPPKKPVFNGGAISSTTFKMMKKPTYGMYYGGSYAKDIVSGFGCNDWVCGEPGTLTIPGGSSASSTIKKSGTFLVKSLVSLLDTYRCCRDTNVAGSAQGLIFDASALFPYDSFEDRWRTKVTIKEVPCKACERNSTDPRPQCGS